MSFFQSMFGSAPAAAAAPAPAANTEAAASPNKDQAPTTPQSPLDSFSELWQNDPNAEQPAAGSDAIFNADPKAINEAVGKMNFLGQIPPKVQEALKAGGEDATRASLFLMNQVAQQAYGQSAQTTAKIVEAALAKQAEAFESRVSEVIRKNGASEQIRSANPAFAHPAAQPILQGIQTQMQAKYPKASASEIASMAQNYLSTFAAEISGAGKPKQAASKNDTDFSDFFN